MRVSLEFQRGSARFEIDSADREIVFAQSAEIEEARDDLTKRRVETYQVHGFRDLSRVPSQEMIAAVGSQVLVVQRVGRCT